MSINSIFKNPLPDAVDPGLHPDVNLSNFDESELKIINKLKGEWYITNGGTTISLARSNYKYLLMKPTSNYQELFNIEREIIVIFSNYSNFEPRTIDAFDAVSKSISSDLRLERVCGVLISQDSSIELKIKNLLKSDPEFQVIVPFSYSELLNEYDSFFIRNKFRTHFYSRDLFDVRDPLKRDFYFFGRTDLIQETVNRHKSGGTSGLFGLRKTGKTSIVFGIQRVLANTKYSSVYIDCQDPSFHQKKWNKALKYIIDEIKKTLMSTISVSLIPDNGYTEEQASQSFEKDLQTLKILLEFESILLIFDEIEHISYNISATSHWKEDNDFLFFWQTLRSVYQKNDNLFTYLIVGTNPTCVEVPTINGVDNPIFNQITPYYIPAFDVPQTREMVRKIGRIVGLNFDETLYARLSDDFGGHPFLIRLVCSSINQKVEEKRPVRIDKIFYDVGKNEFYTKYFTYIEMILSVLKDHYSTEYDMLRHLALGDIKKFEELASTSPISTTHLLGYNIIDRNCGNYSFKIDLVKDYLLQQNKYQKIHMGHEEKLSEISERRNHIEPELKKLTRNVLRSNLGEAAAQQYVLDILGDPRKTKYFSKSYKELFDPQVCDMYISDLSKIIKKQWGYFSNLLGFNLDQFLNDIEIVNKYRNDAHATPISDDEMVIFRLSISRIENYIHEYFSD